LLAYIKHPYPLKRLGCSKKFSAMLKAQVISWINERCGF